MNHNERDIHPQAEASIKTGCPSCADWQCGSTSSTVKIKIRPMGSQDYEVRRNGVVAGTAHFERFHTSDGISIRAWIDRPNHETMTLNSVCMTASRYCSSARRIAAHARVTFFHVGYAS